MIKSMTGYSRVSRLVDGKEITLEIRTVNHRYLDFSIKLPRIYGYLEEKIKEMVSAKISRGKTDVFLTIDVVSEPDFEITVNDHLLKNYLNAFDKISSEYNIDNDITTTSLLRLPDIFRVVKTEEDEDKLWEGIKPLVEEAINSLLSMRETEGEKLYTDLKERAKFIENATYEIEKASLKTLPEYKDKLLCRIKDLVGDIEIDENRLLTEIALFADKISITEELVRLRSHVSQFYLMLEENVPIGRKMDFLIQEMNREINTIGSKCSDINISKLVVSVKAEIEKIREQVQNIE